MTDKAPKPPKKRPADANQLGKLVVDISIGETEDSEPKAEIHGKDPAAVSLGRRGGLKGGAARAERLSSERKSEIAKKAALSRWGRKNKDERK